MTRGPVELVAYPPADLGARALPCVVWPSGSRIIRIHRADRGPLHFSPGTGRRPAGRFDSATGRFGVLYAAQSFAGAFAETLLRNPARSLISVGELRARAVSVLTIRAAMPIVDLTGPGLSQLGLDARLVSGPYGACGAWADALHDHPALPGGIAYPSRFDPSQTSVALFERSGPCLAPAAGPICLADMLGDVAVVLNRYGKAIDEGGG